MTPHEIWVDPVWSKVIGGVITAALIGLSKVLKWPKVFWKPALRETHAFASDQSSAGAMYPLKYYLEVINDSKKCVAVRVSAYEQNTVTLQKFVPETLQIMLEGQWLPTPTAAETVAILPNQRCRAWVGVDASKFTSSDLERSKGRIGTLILTANGKKIPFKL